VFEVFRVNKSGRDFAVANVQGCLAELRQMLDQVAFDTTRDRLFSAGGMVNRGKSSAGVLALLGEGYFHSVRGRQEQLLIDHSRGLAQTQEVLEHGGQWFLELGATARESVLRVLTSLPYAIEVATETETIGIVHADCPKADWRALPLGLADEEVRHGCLFSDSRIERCDATPVAGVNAVVVANMPLSAPVVLGNVHHIDTGVSYSRGYATLLQLSPMVRILNRLERRSA